MKHNNLYEIHPRMKIPPSMVWPVERMRFVNQVKEICACIVVLVCAVAFALALNVL